LRGAEVSLIGCRRLCKHCRWARPAWDVLPAAFLFPATGSLPRLDFPVFWYRSFVISALAALGTLDAVDFDGMG